MATLESDVLFSSFVNFIVLAPMFAQENRISREISREMPLMSIFGSDLSWALRDAISYSGSYDQIKHNHIINGAEEEQGRNTLNTINGPQLHSYPGISPQTLISK